MLIILHHLTWVFIVELGIDFRINELYLNKLVICYYFLKKILKN